MRVKFVLPDGRTVEQLMAYHRVPKPNSQYEIEGRTYEVLTVSMALAQDSAEALIHLSAMATSN